MRNNQENLKAICVGISIGCLLIGFVLGCMFTNYNIIKIVGSLQIEELNIELNETQIVNAIYDKFGIERNLTEKGNISKYALGGAGKPIVS